MKRMKQLAAAVLSAALLTGILPSAAYAGVVQRNVSAASSSDSSASSSSGGTDVSASSVHPDTEAPAASRTYAYTKEEAQATAEQLYSFEQNAVKKEIDVSYLMNSIWYDPDNLLVTDDGQHLLKLYSGSPGNYERAYLEALDGLECFSSPTVMFLPEASGGLLVAVETGGRFTEEEAYNNYTMIRTFIDQIISVQKAVQGMDDADKAKYICDYVASHLTYDTTYQKNSLADAVRSGVTDCMGYNNMAELLFEHCGIPYISIVANAKDQDVSHIFGLAKIQNSWLIFDTTNYDRDDAGTEAYWIFSDRYREGRYYTDMRLVEEQPADSEASGSAR